MLIPNSKYIISFWDTLGSSKSDARRILQSSNWDSKKLWKYEFGNTPNWLSNYLRFMTSFAPPENRGIFWWSEAIWKGPRSLETTLRGGIINSIFAINNDRSPSLVQQNPNTSSPSSGNGGGGFGDMFIPPFSSPSGGNGGSGQGSGQENFNPEEILDASYLRAMANPEIFDPGTVRMIMTILNRSINGEITPQQSAQLALVIIDRMNRIEHVFNRASMLAYAASTNGVRTSGACCSSCESGGECSGEIHAHTGRDNNGNPCRYGGGCVPMWNCVNG